MARLQGIYKYDGPMDWIPLRESASRLLSAITQFGVNDVDANVAMSLANQHDPAWNSNPAVRRQMFQALELLEYESLIYRGMTGTIRLTETGRAAAESPALTWITGPQSPSVREWIELEDLRDAVDAQRPSSELTITRLSVSNWRQFDAVDLEIHPRLTVLTGANAAGKTTLLNLLAPHFNWSAQLVSKAEKSQSVEDSAGVQVGQLRYSNGVRASLWQQPSPGISMSSISYSNMEAVPGIFISSHRSVSSYRQLDSLPARFSEADTILRQFSAEVQAHYSGGSSQYSPLYRMKEALIAAALHGYGSAVVRETPAAIEIWEGFQDVLRAFLPTNLHFRGLLVENGELLLKTATAEFPLEAASGGLAAMLELSWQIFLRGQNSNSFTVCIDEPENHLHPELQRVIVPALLEAFPQATFIVSTHSPFVVTSTRDCLVYALGPFGGGGRISSRLLDDLNASGTADETLQTVLGLDTPLPLWAQKELAAAIERLPGDATGEDLRALRAVLAELGLDRQFPAAVAAIGEGRK